MTENRLAMNGGQPAKTKPFPEWPDFDEQEVAALTRVLESRMWWRVPGTEVEAFEREFATYQQARAALAVTSGTHAIETVLSGLGIGRGDEVIVPAYTFVSTAFGVLSVNAVPILVDVDPRTYCLDPQDLQRVLSPRTRAIMPVHLAGNIANMDAIMEFARRHHLAVIEDAAHAHGGEWQSQRVGALASAGIFSFQAGKLMTAGEGGCIVSQDTDLIERCYLMSSCGRSKKDRTYQHMMLGTTCRMSELHAAVLRVQLTRLDRQISRRERNAEILDKLLQTVEGIAPQGRDSWTTRHPHYMYMFRYDSSYFGGMPRTEFVDSLIAEGVPAFVGYPAIHQTPAFREGNFAPRWKAQDPLLPDYQAVHCPISEELGEQVVWLHHRTLLGDEEDLAELVGAIRKIQVNAPRRTVLN